MEDERETYIVYGKHRGLIDTGIVSHTISATGRIHREETYETFDNPYRLLDREGTRNRRFPALRLTENRVDEGQIGKSKIVKVYDDQWAYRSIRAGRFPRGLVSQGTSLQSGSFNVLVTGSVGTNLLRAAFSANVTYIAATKTFRYYSGLPLSETRATGGSPASSGSVRIINVDLGEVGAELVHYGFDVSAIQPRFDWLLTDRRDNEGGGFWTIEEQYTMMMRVGYVFRFDRGVGQSEVSYG